MRLSKLIVAATLSPLIACGGGGGDNGGAPPPPAAVNSVSLSRSTVTLRPSESSSISATPRDANNTALSGRTVAWSVSPTSGVVNITPNGSSVSISATAVGTAVVTATIEGKTANATINVTNTPFPSTGDVGVSNNQFSPDVVDIAVGGSVTWQWGAQSDIHNVTFSGGAGAPSNIADRQTGSEARTFAQAGTFNYTCTRHAGMSGSIVVH